MWSKVNTACILHIGSPDRSKQETTGALFEGAGGRPPPKEKEKKKEKKKKERKKRRKEKKKKGNYELRQITTYKVLFISNFSIVRWHWKI